MHPLPIQVAVLVPGSEPQGIDPLAASRAKHTCYVPAHINDLGGCNPERRTLLGKIYMSGSKLVAYRKWNMRLPISSGSKQ